MGTFVLTPTQIYAGLFPTLGGKHSIADRYVAGLLVYIALCGVAIRKIPRAYFTNLGLIALTIALVVLLVQHASLSQRSCTSCAYGSGSTYNVSIVAVFRNEHHNMAEWLNHHLQQGVQHFYLVDDASTEPYLHILQPFMKTKTVELVMDYKRHAQSEKYTKHFLSKMKCETTWVLCIDFDEFVYARPPYSLASYLASLPPDIVQISIPWKYFGSSGHNAHPQSITKSLVKRSAYYGAALVKSATRTARMKHVPVHAGGLQKLKPTLFNSYVDRECINADNTPRNCNSDHVDFRDNVEYEAAIDSSMLHLNHYQYQSYEWYTKVKLPRGDVAQEFWDNKYKPLTQEEFHRIYSNRADFMLANLTANDLAKAE